MWLWKCHTQVANKNLILNKKRCTYCNPIEQYLTSNYQSCMLDNYRITPSRWWNKSTKLESLYHKRCWWHSWPIALNCNLNKWTHANWWRAQNALSNFPNIHTRKKKHSKPSHIQDFSNSWCCIEFQSLQ